jgi:hypothetical protein
MRTCKRLARALALQSRARQRLRLLDNITTENTVVPPTMCIRNVGYQVGLERGSYYTVHGEGWIAILTAVKPREGAWARGGTGVPCRAEREC